MEYGLPLLEKLGTRVLSHRDDRLWADVICIDEVTHSLRRVHDFLTINRNRSLAWCLMQTAGIPEYPAAIGMNPFDPVTDETFVLLSLPCKPFYVTTGLLFRFCCHVDEFFPSLRWVRESSILEQLFIII